jgi:hypothetical protein
MRADVVGALSGYLAPMFARLVRFQLSPDDGAIAQELANELAPLIAVQPGCTHVTMFSDRAGGDCGLFVLWETQQHAEAAAGVIGPQLEKHLGGHLRAGIETQLFEVLSD